MKHLLTKLAAKAKAGIAIAVGLLALSSTPMVAEDFYFNYQKSGSTWVKAGMTRSDNGATYTCKFTPGASSGEWTFFKGTEEFRSGGKLTPSNNTADNGFTLISGSINNYTYESFTSGTEYTVYFRTSDDTLWVVAPDYAISSATLGWNDNWKGVSTTGKMTRQADGTYILKYTPTDGISENFGIRTWDGTTTGWLTSNDNLSESNRSVTMGNGDIKNLILSKGVEYTFTYNPTTNTLTLAGGAGQGDDDDDVVGDPTDSVVRLYTNVGGWDYTGNVLTKGEDNIFRGKFTPGSSTSYCIFTVDGTLSSSTWENNSALYGAGSADTAIVSENVYTGTSGNYKCWTATDASCKYYDVEIWKSGNDWKIKFIPQGIVPVITGMPFYPNGITNETQFAAIDANKKFYYLAGHSIAGHDRSNNNALAVTPQWELTEQNGKYVIDFTWTDHTVSTSVGSDWCAWKNNVNTKDVTIMAYTKNASQPSEVATITLNDVCKTGYAKAGVRLRLTYDPNNSTNPISWIYLDKDGNQATKKNGRLHSFCISYWRKMEDCCQCRRKSQA